MGYYDNIEIRYNTRFVGGCLDGQRKVLSAQQVVGGCHKVDVMEPRPVGGYLDTSPKSVDDAIRIEVYRLYPEVVDGQKRWVGILESF